MVSARTDRPPDLPEGASGCEDDAIALDPSRRKRQSPRPAPSAGEVRRAVTPAPADAVEPDPVGPALVAPAPADVVEPDPVGPALVAPALADAQDAPIDPHADPTPAQLASTRLGDAAVPTETFGHRRLDLRTPEAPVTASADTPAPLTARGLASVRREAGATLFSDGRHAPGDDDGWDNWAGEHEPTDDRMAQLDDDLGRRRTPIGRFAARRRRARDDHAAEGRPTD